VLSVLGEAGWALQFVSPAIGGGVIGGVIGGGVAEIPTSSGCSGIPVTGVEGATTVVLSESLRSLLWVSGSANPKDSEGFIGGSGSRSSTGGVTFSGGGVGSSFFSSSSFLLLEQEGRRRRLNRVMVRKWIGTR